MTLRLLGTFETKGTTVNIRLENMDIKIIVSSVLLCLAGGIIRARNIPNRPTLSAEITGTGNIFPKADPIPEPIIQQGDVIDAIPNT